jgi:CRP-like cAMP-binding protein
VFRNVAGRDTTLRELGAGEMLGELSLLLGSARTASVEAVEDCIVLVIDRSVRRSRKKNQANIASALDRRC